jgi:secondary thiamine-phosphate synthase enzyme
MFGSMKSASRMDAPVTWCCGISRNRIALKLSTAMPRSPASAVPYAASVLRQFTTSLTFETRGRGLLEITRPVVDWVSEAGLATGLLTLYARHTSASLLIQENADPDVRGDLDRFFARLVPDGDALFRHRDEGADDMPAHVRAALTAVQLSVPLSGGRLVLGTWQGIYLWEHRVRPHRREVALHLLGE